MSPVANRRESLDNVARRRLECQAAESDEGLPEHDVANVRQIQGILLFVEDSSMSPDGPVSGYQNALRAKPPVSSRCHEKLIVHQLKPTRQTALISRDRKRAFTLGSCKRFRPLGLQVLCAAEVTLHASGLLRCQRLIFGSWGGSRCSSAVRRDSGYGKFCDRVYKPLSVGTHRIIRAWIGYCLLV
jgi:hypothetical protein